jgi:hypothetical protein
MSYKYAVLSDSPILFYRSNQVFIDTAITYQQVINGYSTYQSFQNAFPSYDSAATNIIQDSSPCNNDAEYTGYADKTILPLITGESHAIKIDTDSSIIVSTQYDYNQLIAAGGLGTAKTSDNDFTLETWFYPSFITTNKTPIMADLSENVGLFYEKGNITFAVDSEQITYTLPYLKKSYHIVATYSGDLISLYLDKILVASKSLTNFLFTNLSLSMKSGPTLNSSDYFLVNGMAAYRYSLSPTQIELHYNMAQPLIPIQIASPDQGELFQFYDNSISKQFSYSYPANKPWPDFATTDLYYDPVKNSLQMIKGSGISKSIIIEDFITIPSGPTIDSSRIEWEGDNGIIVQTSIDGITYVNCVNGQSIPQYKLGSFNSSRDLHIKITMSSTDDSKYLPILSSLSIGFYNNQKMFAQNSTSFMSTLEGVSGVTEFEIDLSNNIYNVLSKDARNGLRVVEDSGFRITTDRLTNTLEFFYTPAALDDSGLLSSSAGTGYSASEYSWRTSGTIYKTNISAIYVNGINKTSQTNVSNVFAQGELHHVVIVFSSPISNVIKFNHSAYGSVSALYQNITMYEPAFDSVKADLHYDLYLGTDSTVLSDSSFTVTENSVTPYNNDWLVYQTV